MADILIRGIPKSTDCGKCFIGDRTMCVDGCPLHELPEHGDLIDRVAFDDDARKRYCSACDNYNGTKCRACWVDDMLGDVADFDAVIPQNKGETE